MADASWVIKAGPISHLCLDVDGILTDGRLYYSAAGEEAYKAFHVRDGHAIKSWRDHGFEVLVISGRAAPQVSPRMQELGVTDVFLGVEDKLACARRYCQQHDLSLSAMAYMGDDYPDLALLQAAGLGLSVADAAEAVRAQADWVSRTKGGRGAVAEAIAALLQAKQ